MSYPLRCVTCRRLPFTLVRVRQCSLCIRFFIFLNFEWTNLLLLFIILSGPRLSPLGTAATTGLLYQPQMLDDGDCGAIGGMNIGKGNLHQCHFVHHKSHMT
jgi:hypothetical protein